MPPARRPRGEGNPGPLRRSKLAGKRGGGKDGPLKEKSWIGEGERGGSVCVPPHLPHPSQPRASDGAGGGYPGLPPSHLKAARSKVGNKKFLFRTFGLRFGTLRLGAGGGARSRRRRAGEGQRSPDPESRAPHSRPPGGHPCPPLTRCGARAAVKVTGQTAHRRTRDSGPRRPTSPPPRTRPGPQSAT